MGFFGMERRLGHRATMTGPVVEWDLDARSRGRVHRGTDSPDVGHVLDLSVTGAAIVAPTGEHLVPGAPVIIAHEGVRAVCLIRRVERTSSRQRAVFGVEFVNAPTGMINDLMEAVGELPAEDAEEIWNRAS